MSRETSNLSMKELEALGEELSAWAESDEFFEALETATVLPRTPEGVERAEEIVRAATRGRPALAAQIYGPSPTINSRVTPDIKERLNAYADEHNLKPSDVIRDALDSYLPKSATS